MTTQEKEQRKIITIWLTIVLTALACGLFAQTPVVKNQSGYFCELKTMTPDSLSGDKFLAANGAVLPVYISKKGRFYVLHTSKKSGKTYKHFLVLQK